jgi:hypothetical protein
MLGSSPAKYSCRSGWLSPSWLLFVVSTYSAPRFAATHASGTPRSAFADCGGITFVPPRFTKLNAKLPHSSGCSSLPSVALSPRYLPDTNRLSLLVDPVTIRPETYRFVSSAAFVTPNVASGIAHSQFAASRLLSP